MDKNPYNMDTNPYIMDTNPCIDDILATLAAPLEMAEN